MANNIVLSSAIRASLLTLQSTADLQSRVQERLATGKKVNSALDNPTNFFTAASLSRRGNDLSSLLDGMSNGIKTLEAADNAMTSISRTTETMQANIRSARQDKSFKGVSYTHDTAAITAGGTAKNISFSGGAVGTTPVNVSLNSAATAATLTGSQAIAGTYTGGSFTIQATGLNGGNAVNVTIANDDTPAAVVAARPPLILPPAATAASPPRKPAAS
jgi:flagellin